MSTDRKDFQAALESSLAIPQRLNLELSYNLANPLLGIYPREMKTCPYKILNNMRLKGTDPSAVEN